ncbi:hypothetical protein [Henriciella sp.]|uniref:hypothetical protein n=1 Tax=Henriciella sp. TaxID=1968823 RepID=UPI00263267EC|nr:hypothetical protein [Henriciella sp.]
MSERNSTSTKSQLGIAAIGVSLCAACGVAWLGGGGDSTSPSMSFAPTQSTATSSDDGKVTAQSAGGYSAQYAIIVKFENEPVTQEIGKTFRKDPEGTRQRFREWAADKPALQGLSLERASYSGELVLTGSGARSVDDVIRGILAMDNVAYAEPDYIAEPSKEG